MRPLRLDPSSRLTSGSETGSALRSWRVQGPPVWLWLVGRLCFPGVLASVLPLLHLGPFCWCRVGLGLELVGVRRSPRCSNIPAQLPESHVGFPTRVALPPCPSPFLGPGSLEGGGGGQRQTQTQRQRHRQTPMLSLSLGIPARISMANERLGWSRLFCPVLSLSSIGLLGLVRLPSPCAVLGFCLPLWLDVCPSPLCLSSFPSPAFPSPSSSLSFSLRAWLALSPFWPLWRPWPSSPSFLSVRRPWLLLFRPLSLSSQGLRRGVRRRQSQADRVQGSVVLIGGLVAPRPRLRWPLRWGLLPR